MAQARMISRSLSTSRKWAQLHDVSGPLAEFAQVVYVLLVVHADDFGRLAGDPFTVKHDVLPTSPRSLDEFASALDALEACKLIRRWTLPDDDDERIVIQIRKFDEHQSGLHKRTSSKFAPLSEIPGSSGNLPNPRAGARAKNRTERNGIEERKNALRAQPRPVEKSDPHVAVLAKLMLEEVLPLGIDDDGELVEQGKRAAARHRLAYTGRAITAALASATAQAAKLRAKPRA